MIPKLHYISQGDSPEGHLENIHKACSAGVELVQLRIKNIDEVNLLKTAEKAREITGNHQARLIVNDHYKIAKTVKADGVHLGKADSPPTEARKHLYSWQIIGGTANTVQDCRTLIEKKVDYIGLGPFRFTTTKDNLSPVLGVKGYASLLEELKTETPIIAIGGITIEDVIAILETGVYGIATSGELTKDFSKINRFHNRLQTGTKQEQVWKVNQKT
ncbi:MAG TPA: thiamine phosphate synthase [Gillisia sp.]|nr:thiamine phosphate synthase [Gillisia sp.]